MISIPKPVPLEIKHPEYPLIGRSPQYSSAIYGFKFNNIDFYQDSFHIFAGLNTVDHQDNVEEVFKILSQFNLTCSRMGVYKPRTNPYSFQGLGSKCLSYVFDLAGKYGIQIIAMEVTHESHIEILHRQLEKQGNPTSVILQIGTRNAQNFELLKAVGRQQHFPILLKRGFGISIEESLCAGEYVAKAGNNQIIFCLRGVKSLFAPPHRNFVDFSLVSAILRQTRMPVGIDPSHAIGHRATDMHGIMDIFHVTAQGIISGANMLLVDIHPNPDTALVDSKQALSIKNLPWFLEDIHIAREAYKKRVAKANSA
jgi:3-deoxy-7-phosphoheptulonate synthase